MYYEIVEIEQVRSYLATRLLYSFCLHDVGRKLELNLLFSPTSVEKTLHSTLKF